MKKIITLSSVVLFIINLLFWAILSFYKSYNFMLSSMVIFLTCVLLYVVNIINYKDAIKITLCFLFTIAGFVEFILSLISPRQLVDNWSIISILLIILAEILCLLITHNINILKK